MAARSRPRLLQLDPFKETSGVTPVQGLTQMGLFLQKARVPAVTDPVDLSTRGLTCPLPPILSDPLDTPEEVFGLGRETGRETQIRFCLFARCSALLCVRLCVCVCFEQGERDARPWIGEKPAPLARLKAGSSQRDRTCLPFSAGPGRSPHPHPHPPPWPPRGGPGRDGCPVSAAPVLRCHLGNRSRPRCQLAALLLGVPLHQPWPRQARELVDDRERTRNTPEDPPGHDTAVCMDPRRGRRSPRLMRD